jgi:hypothetical protein
MDTATDYLSAIIKKAKKKKGNDAPAKAAPRHNSILKSRLLSHKDVICFTIAFNVEKLFWLTKQ